ncbi:cytidylate kinase [Granulicatella balaenopterae]|uniref:Cytidylate kinase n=1 Tax=Granulicatella balaenopterae TaxID=137733 RepID=A0A1H9HTA3_9LACT|nr:(d)CMP kinase [Granulicatella balaenopterae]SEQ65515.1 cytidylate kinase [Granulicatella balaenopterae]
MQIAIDGPASSGKSTISKKIANMRGLLYLDTGAMYRVVTLAALQHKIDPSDEESVKQLLSQIKIHFETSDNGQLVFLNGENVTDTIRGNQVTNNVSAIAAQKLVREEMVKRQRDIAANHSIIMDGRDIGTVVLPDADLKVFLIATAEERANRRFKENQLRGIETDYRQLLEEIKHRDYLDSTRKESPLKKADDAIELDSTPLTIDQVVDTIVKWIDESNN